MTRKERLLATIRGERVDRPPVNFYEINGLDENPNNNDPYNIYSHPSWLPLINLTKEKTDRIVMRGLEAKFKFNPLAELTKYKTFIDGSGTRNSVMEIRSGNRVLKSHSKRETDANTEWTVEHLLKGEDDLRAWIDLPEGYGVSLEYSEIISTEEKLGDSGIVMLDTADALCQIASMFSMENFTIIAMTEQKLFRKALDKAHRELLKTIEKAAKEMPGRLWRIFGPEYASPPYLPPYLYEEYVVKYDKEIIDIIHKNGGYARIHQHGNQKDILDMTVKTGCMAIDPIEPPPQGDVTLKYVKERYGRQIVLFGNLEVSDIELLQPCEFEKKVITAMEEGMAGKGRGFVLMPSACPYGRVLSKTAYENYCRMIEIAERYKY